MYFNACRRGTYIDARHRRQCLDFVARRGLLPLGFRAAGIGLGFFFNQFLDAVDDGIWILSRWNEHLQLVPHPLARSGEVEEVTFDGEAVYERNAPAGGMPGVGPTAGFEQDRLQQTDLDHF